MNTLATTFDTSSSKAAQVLFDLVILLAAVNAQTPFQRGGADDLLKVEKEEERDQVDL